MTRARIRLKRVATVAAGQSPPSQDVVDYEGEGLPFLQGNAEFDAMHPKPRHRCDGAPRVAKQGDILVSVRAPVGEVNLADRSYGIGRGLAAIRTGAIDRRYAYWLLKSSSEWLNSIATGSTFTAVSGEDLGNVPVPVAAIGPQRAIADYLDRETAQIDAFIAKSEELITLLTERRVATITKSVTSGLSSSSMPQAEHWAASVPDHWRLMPLHYAIRRIDQGVSPQADAGLAAGTGQIGVLKSGCANRGVFLPEEHKVLPSDFVFDPAIRIEAGDLLVNRASGSVPLLGSAAIVTENPYQLILSDKTFRIWPSAYTSRSFLYWLLNSRPYREQVEASVSGAEGLANNLPMSRLRSFKLPFPPGAEQLRIIEFLDRETAAIDKAILAAVRGIDLAQERRAALISAAVTGKIDVGVSA